MTNQSLPNIRVCVDWDGDGWINKGGQVTDPLNLAVRPLTLYNQILKNGWWAVSGQIRDAYHLPAYYDPTDRGLFATEVTGTGAATYIGSSDNIYDGFLYYNPSGYNGTYTAQFYIKGMSNYVGKTMRVKIQDAFDSSGPPIDDAARITQTAQSFSLTNSWQLITYTFTLSLGSPSHQVLPTLVIEQTGGGSPYPVWRITGLSVTAGTPLTGWHYNVGTDISRRDDISSYVMSAMWQLGMGASLDNVAAEGTATVQVRNTSGEFSYEKSTSFLYGGPPFASQSTAAQAAYYPYDWPTAKYKLGVLSTIEIQDEVTGNWSEVWRGFLNKVDVGTGASSPVATLTMTQGLFKFSDIKLDMNVLQNVTADEIITALINSGWVTAALPNQAAIGKTQIRSEFTYDVVSSLDTYLLDAGLAAYAFSGDDWSADSTSPVDVIRDLMTVEQGLFFVDRVGRVRFLHRDRIYSTASTEPADIELDDSDVNAQKYDATQGLINSVTVEYSPKEIVEGTLWTSKEPFVVNPGAPLRVTAKLESPDRTKLTAISVNSFFAPTNASIRTVTDMAGNVLPSTNVRIMTSLRNGEVDMAIQNFDKSPVKVSIILKGTMLMTYAGMSTTVNYELGQVGIGAQGESVSSKLLSDLVSARQLGEYILQLKGHQYATFSQFTITSRDATWLQRILTTTIGSRIKMRETNAGNIYHRIMVVGESGSWTPGVLTMTYTTRPADNVPYLVLNSTPFGGEGLVY